MRIRWFCLLAWVLVSAAAHAAELASASMMCPNGEPFLLYGAGLDQAGVKVWVSDLKPPKEWNASDSLARVLRHPAPLPPRPDAGAKQLPLLTSGVGAAVVTAYANEWSAPGKAIWAQSPDGISAPLPLNRPEIWTTCPPRPVAGSKLRIFGINFNTRGGIAACIVDSRGTIRPCDWGLSYSGEKGISPAFERTIVLPAGAAPGSYRLYINASGGDYGWSEPFAVELIAPPAPGAVVRCDDAPADGQTDAAGAIQKAIDQAAAQGGGVVSLKAGVFVIHRALVVKPGVTLRGAGRGGTLLQSPTDAQIPAVFNHYRPVVAMGDRAALEDLTVDATPGDGHSALLIRHATDAAVRRCELRNLKPVFRPEGKWVAADNVVTATQDIRRLVFEDNLLRGPIPFTHWGGVMSELYFAHNTCQGLPTDSATVGFHGLRRSVIEHNRILRGGRGMVVAGEAVHNYFGFNTVQDIRGTANGCEMFIYEMGLAPWEGAPSQVGDGAFTTPGKTWDDKTLRSTADSFIYTTYALVLGGRGMGQCIPVKQAAGERITLARPWTLKPDATSSIAIVYGCMENLHIENQYKDGVAYSGVFGAAVRNVWAGEEFERVTDGMALWGLGADHPVSLNILRDIRMQERGGILLLEGMESAKPPAQSQMVGNEIRTCQVYDRQRFPGNEYGLGQKVWRWAYNNMPPGNARHVTFGSEAGIHLSAFLDWPGSHTDEDAKLDALPPGMRWTLIYDSLVARSPVGLRIGRGIAQTAVVDFDSALNGKPVSDSGRQTFVSGLREEKPPAK